MSSVNQVLAGTLTQNGVDTLFGLVGDGNLFMVEAYVREKTRYVPAYHEASAVLMAQGYARATGKVGVATVTHGPGLSNTITPLIEAVRSRIPMVLITGDTAPATSKDVHLQDIDQRALVKATGATLIEISRPERASHDLCQALHLADTLRTPVVLNLPYQMIHEDVDVTILQREFSNVAPVGPDIAALDEPLGVIASAQRPVILAGWGAVDHRGAIEQLAHVIGAPIATTLLAKGLFAGSAAAVGVLGNLGTALAADTVVNSDCLIVFGAGLNQHTTMNGSLLEDKAVIQIDSDWQAFGRFNRPHHAIHGDVGVTAAAITQMLTEAEVPSTDYVSRAQGAELWPEESPSSQAPLDYIATMRRLNAALPRERVVITDAGRTMGYAARLLDVPGPRSWAYTWQGFGSIGLGMGTAIGAAVARPDATTVLVAGDGGFMMGGLTELQAVMNESLDMVVVVCNDGAYGMEYIQTDENGLPPGTSRINVPDFAAVAQSFGFESCVVAADADIEVMEKFLENRRGPALIEVRLDPAHVPF